MKRKIPNDVLLNVASCVFEICRYRQSMDAKDWDDFAHGQMLVGFVKGVALGMGMETEDLLTQTRPFLDDPELLDSLWITPN